MWIGGKWRRLGLRRRGRGPISAKGASRVERRRREDRGAEGADEVWGGVSLFPLGEGAVPPPRKTFRFLNSKGEFWCILGLIKHTFDRPGVSIFWTDAV